MTAITVLDFGMGNLRSVAKALERAGADVRISPEVEQDAAGLVVPGQGAFGSCVVNLGDRLAQIRDWVAAGKPYLGICLGLQVLFEGSEEEPGARGTGVFEGEVRRLPDDVKTPHIGWNTVDVTGSTRLFAGIDDATRFYFVHSFAPEPADPSLVAATTEYGVRFACAVERDNVMATQFHPEKSGDAGADLLANFIGICAA